jgi:hypothetical protein
MVKAATLKANLPGALCQIFSGVWRRSIVFLNLPFSSVCGPHRVVHGSPIEAHIRAACNSDRMGAFSVQNERHFERNRVRKKLACHCAP